MFRKIPSNIKDSIVGCLEGALEGNIVSNKLSITQSLEINELLKHCENSLRVISYNMLFNLNEDQREKVHRWKKRISRIAKLIDHIRPDIMGTQELLGDQIEDLNKYIGNRYGYFGRYSSQGVEAGMDNGIFYLKERLKLLESRVIFSSSTPEVPSVDPFGEQSFIVVAKFLDKDSGKEFLVINTHLAFYSADSREYAANFIANFISQIDGREAVILTGDFNTFPFRPDMLNLPFYDGDLINKIITKHDMEDSIYAAKLGHIGPLSTFTCKDSDVDIKPFSGTGTPGVILDHIYINDKVNVLVHAIESARIGGYFPSDHMPVIIDVTIN